MVVFSTQRSSEANSVFLNTTAGFEMYNREAALFFVLNFESRTLLSKDLLETRFKDMMTSNTIRAGITAAVAILAMSISARAAQKEDVKFPMLSIAPELGYQFFGKTKLEKNFDTELAPRNGVTVKIHADIGGDRWALELAPLYAWQGSADGLAGNMSALGGEITWVYRFSRGAGLYPHIGLGFRGTYLLPDEKIQRGCELGARIPLGVTWYFLKYLGLVLEGGLMLGTVGVRFKDGPDIRSYALSKKTEFGFSIGFELSVGLRFP